MRILVVPMILQVKRMVVQETWPENIKNKRRKNSVKIILKKNDSIRSKISKGITEEDVIISLFAKYFLLQVTKAVILSIETYKQDILSVGYENKSYSHRQIELL